MSELEERLKSFEVRRARKPVAGKIIRTFYIPGELSEIIDKLKELAAREKISVNMVILRALVEYIKRHYPGNPQIPLFPDVSVTQDNGRQRFQNCK